MRVIKALKDIQLLKKAKSLDQPYLDYLENQFFTLYFSLANNQPIQEFSLAEHGFLVVLEAGDNVRDLQEVGLNPEDRGLLCGSHEYVNIDTLCNGIRVYNIGILCNNEYMMVFITKMGQFSYDDGVEEWLKTESC